jgi:uncharacterized membrane protein
MNFGMTLAIAALPSFLASTVELVEALTIVLAVGITRGWRDAVLGTLAALATLAVLTIVIGTALVTIIPLHLFQIVVGTLLLLFGLRWLRKAILRFAGIIALHDEELIYQREVAALRAQGLQKEGVDWFGFAVTFKAVLLEGLEVVFIVITLGTGASEANAMPAAILGAVAAAVLVLIAGAVLRQPLANIPENWLKFCVGLLLTSFGVFWSTEGFGVEWPLGEISLFVIVATLAVVSWLAARMLRTLLPEGAHVAARNV